MMSLIPISGLHRYEKMAIEDAITGISQSDRRIRYVVDGSESLPREILKWGGSVGRVGAIENPSCILSRDEEEDVQDFDNILAPDNYTQKRGRDVSIDLRDFPLPTQAFRDAAKIWRNQTPRQGLRLAVMGVKYEFATIEKFLNLIENTPDKIRQREFDIIELTHFYEDPKVRPSTKVFIVSAIACLIFFAWFAVNPASALMGFGIAFGVVGVGSLAWKGIVEKRPFTTYERNPKLIMENQVAEV